MDNHVYSSNKSFWFDPIFNSSLSSSKSSISSSSRFSIFFVFSPSSLQLYLVTIISCCIISFSSMFTLFIFLYFVQNRRNIHRNQSNESQKFQASCHNNSSSKESYQNEFDPHKSEMLKLILAFAVGALVADVFLHILPEASAELSTSGYSPQNLQHFLGVWILIGLILFASIETFFELMINNNERDQEESHNLKEKEVKIRSHSFQSTQSLRQRNTKLPIESSHSKINTKTLISANISSKVSNNKIAIHATGYLNLLANGFDNFTHGMSVAASFLVSYKMGVMTTIAIALHEIPHEIVDFVILLRSGFTCWDAFRAQLSISLVTVFGSISVLYFDQFLHPNDSTSLSLISWILPLTSGGFIYIALTSLLPELLNIDQDEEDNLKSYQINGSNKCSPSNRLLGSTLRLKKHGRLRKKIQIISLRFSFIILGVIVMEAINTIDM